MFTKDFTDKMLEKIERNKIIKMFTEGYSSLRIAKELNISEDWVDEVVKDYEQEIRNKMNELDLKTYLDPNGKDYE